MRTLKVNIPSDADPARAIPVAIPELTEVRALAEHLHALGRRWRGELYGWPAAYTPERRRKPQGSKQAFTPAEFWIGESGLWFFSLMWERGKDREPVAFEDARGVVG